MRCRKISLRGSSSSIVHVQRDGLLYSCGRSTSPPPHLPKGLTKGGEKEGSSFAKQIAQKKFFTRADMKFKKKKNNPAKFIALFRACTRNMSVNEPFYHTSCLFLFFNWLLSIARRLRRRRRFCVYVTHGFIIN